MCTSRRASLGLLPVCLLAAACGAKSSLAPSGDASGEGGAGGAGASGATGTATSTGTATGSGGAGGTPGACQVLVVDGPPLSPTPAVTDDEQLVPRLVRTEPDGSSAAFVYIERADSSETFFQTSSVALHDPWGAWPTSLGSSAPHGPMAGFVAGPDRDGMFSLLTTDETEDGGDPSEMVLWTPIAGVPGASSVNFTGVLPGYPLLVTSNGDQHLWGFQRPLGDSLLHLSLVQSVAGEAIDEGPAVACSLGVGISAAAIPLGDTFLAAFSNGRPFAHCLTDDLPDGPPTRLQIVTAPGKFADASLVYEQEQPSSYVFQTHLTAAGAGAWAAWERIPFEPPFERRIQLLQLDAAGFPVNGKVIEVGYGIVGVPFAITAVGSRLVLATMQEEPGSAPVLAVRVLAEDGALAAELILGADDGFELDSSAALLASPAGDQLLVAWSESSAINNDTRRVRVARLACAAP